MGMLGGRYGWIPDGHERSITEDEVRYGVLERDAEIWGNAFFYFRSEESTASIIEETPGDFREPAGSENARKLADLKQSIVNARLPVLVYGATWDVQEKRLTGLEAFGDHVFADLLQNIQDDPELDDHFAASTEIPVNEFAEEREAMEAFIEDRTERYVVGSRQALLDKMIDFAAASSEQNILVIEGEPGSGKSALLGKFCQLLASRPHDVLISHFVGASVGSTNLRRTLRRLCHELAAAVNNSDPLPEDARELTDRFRKLLGEVAAHQRVTLIIDAINQFDATDGAHDMYWVPLALPPNVRFIASTLEHPALDALRKRSEPVRIERLESLGNEDAQAIIQAFLKRYSKRFSPEQIAALLAKREGRLPLYILTALQELRTLGTHAEITARIQELPGETTALFAWILKQRLSSDPGFRNAEGQLYGSALVAKFASCLGVSRHGLSQEELIGLLDAGDPKGNVAALLRLLRRYLMHRGELIDFFHGQLREAVELEYLDDHEKQVEAHRFLSVNFHDAADPNREGHWNGTSIHALSELPYHQVRAEAWPELIATLENIFFLEAKVTHGMAFDLGMDFSDAVEHLPSDHTHVRILNLLEEALRRHLHFIAGHAHDYPQALFQCLWNTCWWYDCPETAKYYETSDGPWNERGEKLFELLESWRTAKENAKRDCLWLRSNRPELDPTGSTGCRFFSGPYAIVECLAISPDGQHIAIGSGVHGHISVWDLHSQRLSARLPGGWVITSIAFSPDGQRIVFSEGDPIQDKLDGTIVLLDARTHAEIASVGLADWGTSIAFLSDGQQVIYARPWKRGVWKWNPTDGTHHPYLEDSDSLTTFALSGDGRYAATGSAGGTISLWNLATRQKIARFVGHKGWVNSVAFSPDGRRLVSGSSDKTVRVWDVHNQRELACLNGHTAKVDCVTLSPNECFIASGAQDRTVLVWDGETFEPVASLCGHTEGVTCVSFSVDGRSLLSGSGDGTVRQWHTYTGLELPRLPNHEERIRAFRFSADGRWLASAASDRTVRVWHGKSGVPALQLSCPNLSVQALAISNEGPRIALAGQQFFEMKNGYGSPGWKIFDMATAADFLQLCEREILAIDFSVDDRCVRVKTRDAETEIFDARTGERLQRVGEHNFGVD
jgi:WD40 repeat protein